MTTILSQTSTRLNTVEPLFPDDYARGLILIEWTERGRARTCLDGNELRAVLCELPTDLLIAALGKRGVLCAMVASALAEAIRP